MRNPRRLPNNPIAHLQGLQGDLDAAKKGVVAASALFDFVTFKRLQGMGEDCDPLNYRDAILGVLQDAGGCIDAAYVESEEIDLTLSSLTKEAANG